MAKKADDVVKEEGKIFDDIVHNLNNEFDGVKLISERLLKKEKFQYFR